MLASFLIIVSVIIYIVQITLFSTPEQTYFYLLQDLAFVPVQVLVVSVFINRIMNSRENRQKNKKINVIISSFFIDCGTYVISQISGMNNNIEEIRNLTDSGLRQKPDFNALREKVTKVRIEVECSSEKLRSLKVVLDDKKAAMLTMLENSSLLEHDSFTDMLWAVFHVADELCGRSSLDALPAVDMAHLANDITRAYRALVSEWFGYMKYLKAEYAYLYSIALRRNPFYEDSDVTIRMEEH